jgi:hypothetical protein
MYHLLRRTASDGGFSSPVALWLGLRLLRITNAWCQGSAEFKVFFFAYISTNMDHKREVWLLRHGATEWSKNGRHTGRSDIPLLPEGEEQAKALAGTLAGRSFAKVLVSPALRARRTCELAGLMGSAEVTEDLWE